VSEGLTQGPYAVARVEFEHVIIRLQGTKPTNEPPHLRLDVSVNFQNSRFHSRDLSLLKAYRSYVEPS